MTKQSVFKGFYHEPESPMAVGIDFTCTMNTSGCDRIFGTGNADSITTDILKADGITADLRSLDANRTDAR